MSFTDKVLFGCAMLYIYIAYYFSFLSQAAVALRISDLQTMIEVAVAKVDERK